MLQGGMGKTTALCAMTLAMVFNPDIGKVFGSGPTHVAINNFAGRLYQRGAAVVERYNAGKNGDGPRARRPLVVRGFKLRDEIGAFKNILKSGVADNAAAPKFPWSPPSRWTYALSATNWLLVLLKSDAAKKSRSGTAVTELDLDDSASMHELQADVDQSPDWARARELVSGKISWAEYNKGQVLDGDKIGSRLIAIINSADIVLTTPATSESDNVYAAAKNKAKGIVIDEAGCLSRADLCSVWGNTLRPLVLAGDALQLRPTAMERRNRFQKDLQFSALAFLQASGLPVYRLRTQLRMCTDMFGAARSLVYKDLDKFQYGPDCDPSGPTHDIGHKFEHWLLHVRKFPGLRPSRPNTLEPVW